MNTLKSVKSLLSTLLSPEAWRTLGRYTGFGNQKSNKVISSPEALAQFINSRASHVTQTSLYGYLKTRAGTRFPELFENPDIMISINIAKWHIWLASVSDLSVFTGLFIYKSGLIKPVEIESLLSTTLDRILLETKIPAEAGEDIKTAIEKVQHRVSTCDWTQDREDDAIFSQSPEALYYWAPIADELKQRDEEIVRNSVRFRWIEVRRSARRLLDIESLFQTETASQQATTMEIK